MTSSQCFLSHDQWEAVLSKLEHPHELAIMAITIPELNETCVRICRELMGYRVTNICVNVVYMAMQPMFAQSKSLAEAVFEWVRLRALESMRISCGRPAEDDKLRSYQPLRKFLNEQARCLHYDPDDIPGIINTEALISSAKQHKFLHAAVWLQYPEGIHVWPEDSPEPNNETSHNLLLYYAAYYSSDVMMLLDAQRNAGLHIELNGRNRAKDTLLKMFWMELNTYFPPSTKDIVDACDAAIEKGNLHSLRQLVHACRAKDAYDITDEPLSWNRMYLGMVICVCTMCPDKDIREMYRDALVAANLYFDMSLNRMLDVNSNASTTVYSMLCRNQAIECMKCPIKEQTRAKYFGKFDRLFKEPIEVVYKGDTQSDEYTEWIDKITAPKEGPVMERIVIIHAFLISIRECALQNFDGIGVTKFMENIMWFMANVMDDCPNLSGDPEIPFWKSALAYIADSTDDRDLMKFLESDGIDKLVFSSRLDWERRVVKILQSDFSL